MFSKLKKIFFGLLSSALIGASLFIGINNNNYQNANADDSVRYTEKIVSVVFDNSGSMSAADDRLNYAKYSMQMLMSLLDSKDTLVITPMNTIDGIDQLEVDLANPDRGKVISDTISSPIFTAQGNTPSTSIDRAITRLTERGMKKSSESGEEKDSKEYWLVVLTDGALDKITDKNKICDLVCSKIDGYSGLRSIYFAFGSGSISLEGTKFETSYPGYAYSATQKESVISGMQKVANMLCGRYSLQDTYITTANNTIKVDLSKLDFSISNIAVVAQDCSYSLTAATYPNKTVNIDRGCSFSQVTKSDTIKSYAANFSITGGYFAGEQLVLTFNGDVSNAQISILIEPALYIECYFEYLSGNTWTKCTTQYINGHLKPGDKIRAGYIVREFVSGKEIDITKIFGTATCKISYGGNSYQELNSIPLVLGNNELVITVSIMNGAYSMITSEMIAIEQEPTYYRVESKTTESYQGNPKKVLVTFTGYSSNKPLTKSDFTTTGYSYTTKLTNPNGDEVEPESVTLADDGTIQMVISIAGTGLYGTYEAYCKITSPQSMSRDNTTVVKFYPPAASVSVKSTGESTISLTEREVTTNTKSFQFTVTTNGEPLVIDGKTFSYKLMIGNYDVSSGATVNGNVVSFIPNKSTLPDALQLADPSGKNVTFSVYAVDDTTISYSCPDNPKFIVTSSTYAVVAIDAGNKSFDIYDINKNQAVTYFSVSCDGELMNEQDLKEGLEKGTITLNNNINGFFVGSEVGVTTVNGSACIYVKVVDTGPGGIWSNLLGSFIFKNNRTVSVSYHGVSSTQTITLDNNSFGQRIWRWAILLVLLLLAAHLICYLLGFVLKDYVAKPLPKGTWVKCMLDTTSDNSDDEVSIKALDFNNEFKYKLLWHLFRLIPLCAFTNQKLKFPDKKVELYWDKDQFAPQLKIKYANHKKVSYDSTEGSEAQIKFDNYIKRIKDHLKKHEPLPKRPSGITTRMMKKFIDDSSDVEVNEKKPTFVNVSNSIVYFVTYDEFDNKRRIARFMFFIKG